MRSEFNYQLLARLQMDCEYYLNAGNRSNKHLCYLNEQDQIAKMKELYNGFDQKPEWLSYEQIIAYEKAMLQGA